MESTSERIAVIGAGAAGLCAAKHLYENGHEVVVFELGSYVGGLWVYQNDNGRSPAYRSLHINSEAKVTGYLDFPIPEEAGTFPSHEKMHAYLEEYADRFGIRKHIKFNSRVTAVESLEGTSKPGWRVRLEDGSEDEFDRVVVANGHQAEPLHPAFAKDFSGKYLHAKDYRFPEPFENKDVLVIGTGNSGLDIAADICTVTRSTTISARSPVLIMPRMFLGVPLSRVLARIEKPWLPWPIRRTVRETITRLVHGRMEKWGFVTPKKQTHPASHPMIFGHMAWGRIRARPGVSSVKGKEVHFTDGSVASFDVIIAATGYEIDLPFLSPELSPIKGHQINLYKRMVHPNFHGLYFVGLFDLGGGANIRMMDVQSKWLTSLINGQIQLPSEAEMIEDYKNEHEWMTKMHPDSPRYGLELQPRQYRLSLDKDIDGALTKKQALDARKAAMATGSGEDFRESIG